MKLFKRKNDKLEIVNPLKFDKEKQLQNLVEGNLDQLFGLEFIASELPVGTYRLDTLAFDAENKTFVVLEYKRDHNSSVVDQGTAYLTTLLKYKADLVLAYNEKVKDVRKKQDFEWDQLKVLFIAGRYEKYQTMAAQFPNLPIELWEVHQYENGLLSVERLDDPDEKITNTKTKDDGRQTSKKDKGDVVENIEDLQPITESTHMQGIDDDVVTMYYRFKDSILAWDPEIEVKANKKYMSFKVGKRAVVDFVPTKSHLKIMINMSWGSLDDTLQLGRDMTNTGHWGNGAYEFTLKDDANFEYVLSLIKQSWRDKKSYQ